MEQGKGKKKHEITTQKIPPDPLQGPNYSMNVWLFAG